MKKRIFALIVLLIIAFANSSYAGSFNADHATAFMEIRFECGCSQYGTGAMIGRYGLITAAHNLYCIKHGKGLKSCNFAFGAKSRASAWYRYDGRFTYRAYETFQNGYNSEDDIGYVIFDTPVGDDTGYFGWIVGTDFDLEWEYNHVSSYNDKAQLQYLWSQEEILDDKQIYWEGYLGYSEGGPVYVNYGDGADENADYCVVAVYTSHDSNGNGYGRRLTNNVIADMRANGAFR